MKIRGFRYFFSEAFKNIFSNGGMTIASIFTVIASLLLLGVFMCLTININSMMGNLQDSYQIVAYVDEKVNEDGISAIGAQLENLPNVSQVTFTNSDQRLENLRQKMGGNGAKLDRYKDDNPLRNMYEITLTDLSLSEDTVKEMKNIDGIAKIQQNEETIGQLVTIANYIRIFSLGIMVALAIIAIFIISNTIKLTVYTRRKEINIMKFVGATDWFIRWPFIIEGIFIGIIGAVFSIGIVLGGYYLLEGVVDSLNIAFLAMKPMSDLTNLIVATSLILGALLGGIGSLISVRKHLNV